MPCVVPRGWNVRNAASVQLLLVLLVVLLATTMIDPTTPLPYAPPISALSLIPAQVLHRTTSSSSTQRQGKNRLRSSPSSSRGFLLIPSQVIQTELRDSSCSLESVSARDYSTVIPDPAASVTTTNGATDSHNCTMATTKSRKARRRRKKTTTNATTTTEPEADVSSPVYSSPPNEDGSPPLTIHVPPPCGGARDFPREGNLPDVYWRSVPLEHLRWHPRFVPLPPIVPTLNTLEDARQFRQDSWQWDALHSGRCTTSQAVACLGLLEPTAGEILKVPPSWRRGGRGAYQRLRQPPLRTLEEMNRVLCPIGDDPPSVMDTSGEPPVTNPWSDDAPSSQDPAARFFAAPYDFVVPDHERRRRQQLARRFGESGASMALRMAWGTAQEGTALLAALNYFAHRDPGFVMKEVGMCGAGLALNESGTLLIGASPDAVLCHSDGRIEACEVKNHCPFVVPFVKKGKSRHKGKPSKRYRLLERPLDGTVFSHYIPQLMMEMLCLGPMCRSAVMLRLTASKGALLLRLHRCDEWIQEMLHFLRKFQSDFVDQGVIPPPNFFLVSNDKLETARYKRFLNKTLELKNSVQVIGYIPAEQVQRLPNESPLFLDTKL